MIILNVSALYHINTDIEITALYHTDDIGIPALYLINPDVGVSGLYHINDDIVGSCSISYQF